MNPFSIKTSANKIRILKRIFAAFRWCFLNQFILVGLLCATGIFFFFAMLISFIVKYFCSSGFILLKFFSYKTQSSLNKLTGRFGRRGEYGERLQLGPNYLWGLIQLVSLKVLAEDEWENPWRKADNRFSGFERRQNGLGDDTLYGQYEGVCIDFLDSYQEYHSARNSGRLPDDFLSTFTAEEFKDVSTVNSFKQIYPKVGLENFAGFDYKLAEEHYDTLFNISQSPFIVDALRLIGTSNHPTLKKYSVEFYDTYRDWYGVWSDFITSISASWHANEATFENFRHMWTAFAVQWHRMEWWLWEFGYRDSVEILRRFDIDAYNYYTNTWIFPQWHYYLCARLGVVCALIAIFFSSLSLLFACYSLGRARNAKLPYSAAEFELSQPIYYLGRVTSYDNIPKGLARATTLVGFAFYMHIFVSFISASIYGLICLPYIIVPEHKGPISEEDDSYVWDADQYYPPLRIWKQLWRAFLESYISVTEGAVLFQIGFFLICLCILVILPALRSENRKKAFWWFEWRRLSIFTWFIIGHYGMYILHAVTVWLIFGEVHPPLARPFNF